MSRFFVTGNQVGENSIIINDRNDVHHISKVLRLREGDEIDISDSRRFEYRCEITRIADGEVEARICDKQSFAREPQLKITLFQGVPKHGKMEIIVQKAVEIGVSEIVPVFMERSVVRDKGDFWKKIVRLRSIAEEAAKQCGRGIVPEIRKESEFSEVPQRLKNFDLVLFPYENEEQLTIKEFLQAGRAGATGQAGQAGQTEQERRPENLAIIIGPEGGFSDGEANTLRFAGFRPVTLGRTILRTETAGIAAAAMCMYELEL